MSFHGRRKMMELKEKRRSPQKRTERARKLEQNQAQINAVVQSARDKQK